jgi:hypothetical protein
MIRGGGPCPFLSYTLEFASQLRKSMENLSQANNTYLNIQFLPQKKTRPITSTRSSWLMAFEEIIDV